MKSDNWIRYSDAKRIIDQMNMNVGMREFLLDYLRYISTPGVLQSKKAGKK